MNSKRFNPKLSPFVAAPVVIAALAVACTMEWSLVQAKERRDNPVRVIDLAYCTKCHSDEKMLKRMQSKEGGTHFLFPEKASKSSTTGYKKAPTSIMKSAPPAKCPRIQ